MFWVGVWDWLRWDGGGWLGGLPVGLHTEASAGLGQECRVRGRGGALPPHPTPQGTRGQGHSEHRLLREGVESGS